MASVPFSYTSANLITGQPSSTAKMFVRSDNAADTSGTVTVYDASSNEALNLAGKVEAQTSATLTDLRWVILSAAKTGNISVYSEDNGIAGEGDITISTNPSDGDTVSIGLSGSTTTYTFKTTVSADGHVKIGATTTETARNLCSAINDAAETGAVDGTDWQLAGTAPAAANAYVSATYATDVVSITDLIKCDRLLEWSITESSTNLSIRKPVGGTNGTLLCTVDAGETEFYNGDLELDTEDLATTTLPGTKTGATDSISLGGEEFTLYIDCENVVTAIQLRLETSNDDTNWRDRSADFAITNADNNNQVIKVYENAQYARLNITYNANTAAAAFNAKINF